MLTRRDKKSYSFSQSANRSYGQDGLKKTSDMMMKQFSKKKQLKQGNCLAPKMYLGILIVWDFSHAFILIGKELVGRPPIPKN